MTIIEQDFNTMPYYLPYCFLLTTQPLNFAHMPCSNLSCISVFKKLMLLTDDDSR